MAWRIGAYAVERLQPSDKGSLTLTDLWMDYLEWCGDRVPVAETMFIEEFQEVASAAGIERRRVEAHVIYEGVAFRTEGDADVDA